MAEPEGPADLLISEPRPLLRGRARAVALLCAAALVGLGLWNNSGTPAPVVGPAVAATTSGGAAPGGVTGGPRVTSIPDHLTQLVFADPSTGFAIEVLCGGAVPGEQCDERVVTTVDAGRTWQARGAVPEPDGGARLVASSPTELTWLNPTLLTEGWRSSDGGLSWSRQPIVAGAAAPAPRGPLSWTFTGCAGLCRHPTPSWIDPVTLVVHELPPSPALTTSPPFTQVSSDENGTVLLSGATGSYAGVVATSIDGGSTWALRLLATDPSIVATQGIAVHGGGYVLATAVDFAAGGSTATRLYRTGDGGVSWQRILVDEPLSAWQVVGSGETGVGVDGSASAGDTLLAVDPSGQLLRSSTAGLLWAEVPGSPRLAAVTAVPGVVWGYSYDGATVQFSTDGGLSFMELIAPPT